MVSRFSILSRYRPSLACVFLPIVEAGGLFSFMWHWHLVGRLRLWNVLVFFGSFPAGQSGFVCKGPRWRRHILAVRVPMRWPFVWRVMCIDCWCFFSEILMFCLFYLERLLCHVTSSQYHTALLKIWVKHHITDGEVHSEQRGPRCQQLQLNSDGYSKCARSCAKAISDCASNTLCYSLKIAEEKLISRQLERKWRFPKLEIHQQLNRQQYQLVQSLIRTAKKEFKVQQIKYCSCDSKRLFRIANDLMNRKQKSPLPTHVANKFYM